MGGGKSFVKKIGGKGLAKNLEGRVESACKKFRGEGRKRLQKIRGEGESACKKNRERRKELTKK